MEKQSRPFVAWGEVLWDRFPSGDELGGAPANVAFHLAGLGAEVALVSRVGADLDGDAARARLGARGVLTDCIQRDVERATGEVGVDIDEAGDARYTLFPGRAWERIECGATERGLLSTARLLCYGTLAQRTAEGRAAHRAALAELANDAIVLCDPNLRRGFADWPLLREALSVATAVKINDHEAAAIETHLGAKAATAFLHDELGVEVVALTRGASGCVLTSRSGPRAEHGGFVAAPGGDNVGCGDAFSAVLALGLAGKWALADIAERANRYAAAVASHRGATPLLSPDAMINVVR